MYYEVTIRQSRYTMPDSFAQKRYLHTDQFLTGVVLLVAREPLATPPMSYRDGLLSVGAAGQFFTPPVHWLIE